jgi:hypothetical protein
VVTGVKAVQGNDLQQEDAGLTRCLHADSDLAVLLAAWPVLPEHIKAAVLALVKTAQLE